MAPGRRQSDTRRGGGAMIAGTVGSEAIPAVAPGRESVIGYFVLVNSPRNAAWARQPIWKQSISNFSLGLWTR